MRHGLSEMQPTALSERLEPYLYFPKHDLNNDMKCFMKLFFKLTKWFQLLDNAAFKKTNAENLNRKSYQTTTTRFTRILEMKANAMIKEMNRVIQENKKTKDETHSFVCGSRKRRNVVSTFLKYCYDSLPINITRVLREQQRKYQNNSQQNRYSLKWMIRIKMVAPLTR